MDLISNRKLFIYSSVFVSLAVTMPQLLALRQNNVLAHAVSFEPFEFIFRIVFNFLFCISFFYINCQKRFIHSRTFFEIMLLGLVNASLFVAFALTGFQLNRALFGLATPPLLPGEGYGLRLGLSMILIAVELKILRLLEGSRQKDIENEQLRNAYLKAELEVLKGQLNPHFFFNALSSLSGVVREDPLKAQRLITQLSRFFRYTLLQANDHLVPLQDELAAVHNYASILEMRFESGFIMKVIAEEDDGGLVLIPHMSLQPLIENAVKHNAAGSASPLIVCITIGSQTVTVENNLQSVSNPEPGSGIGLANLNERFKILVHKEIEIQQTDNSFSVILPLVDNGN